MEFLKKQKGFTLIELLVVVSIVGVLASIVLSSLSETRNKARDARIKSNLVQVRNQAEIYAVDFGSYRQFSSNHWEDDIFGCVSSDPTYLGGTIFKGSEIGVRDIVQEIIEETSQLSFRMYCAVSSNGQTWALSVPLFSPPDGYTGFCIDNTEGGKFISHPFVSAGQPLGGPGSVSCP